MAESHFSYIGRINIWLCITGPPTAPRYTCFGSKLIPCSQFSFKINTAIVTDGARGLGLAFTQVLAEHGANIVVLNIAQPDAALERTKPNYEVMVEYYIVYVANREQVIPFIEKIQKHFISVDIEYALLSPSALF